MWAASKLAAGTEQPTHSPVRAATHSSGGPLGQLILRKSQCSAVSPAAFKEESGVSGTLLETCHVLRAHSRAAARAAAAAAAIAALATCDCCGCCGASAIHHLSYPPAKGTLLHIDLANSSLIGNEPYSKTSAVRRVARCQAREAIDLTKTTQCPHDPRKVAFTRRSHRVFRTTVHTCLHPAYPQPSPSHSIACCHLSPSSSWLGASVFAWATLACVNR